MDRTVRASSLLPFLTALLGMGIAGCGTSEPSRFYLLKASAWDTSQSVSAGKIRVGLHAFKLPPYLMRPNIVTVQEGNRIEIAEYDRWAESLEANLMRVLTINLTRLLPGASVYRYPWRRVPGVAFEVEGEVLRFGLEDDGNVRMVVQWTLRNGGDAVGVDHRFVFARPPVGEGVPSIVGMMNQAVTALSQEIAGEISRADGVRTQ